MISPETDKKIREWFHGCTNGRNLKSLSFENQYNVRNILAGFLQSCEIFGHISPTKKPRPSSRS